MDKSSWRRQTFPLALLPQSQRSHSLPNPFLVLDGNCWVGISWRNRERLLLQYGNVLLHPPSRLVQTILNGVTHSSKPFEVRRVETEEGGVLRGLDHERVLEINRVIPPGT